MRATTALWLAFVGTRTDWVRRGLTVLSGLVCTLTLLFAATLPYIGNVRDDLRPYINAFHTKPTSFTGLYVALGLVALVSLLFVGQCSRLGAAERERRLASYRLTGATGEQVSLFVAIETGLSVTAGALLGTGSYFLLRTLLHQLQSPRKLVLPTDVSPPSWLMILIVVAVPVTALALTLWEARWVSRTPLGVARRRSYRIPSRIPVLFLVIGWPLFLLGVTAALLLYNLTLPPGGYTATTPPSGPPILLLVLFLSCGGLGIMLVAVGTWLANSWLAYWCGRLLDRWGNGPATLLAANRLTTDPRLGNMMRSVVVIAVLGGSVATMERGDWDSSMPSYNIIASFFDGEADQLVYDLVEVAALALAVIAAGGVLVQLVEQVVTGRRALTAAVAAGTPRRVLAAATMIQVMAPVVPAVLLALVPVPAMELVWPDGVPFETSAGAVPFPELAMVGGTAILAVFLATAAGLLFLRSSTDIRELRTR